MDARCDVGGHAEGGGEGVDCAGGVGEEGEVGYVEVGADEADVVWRVLVFWTDGGG